MNSSAAKPHWAILGGTFDPVHTGHLRIAIGLRELGFERVLMMPNHIPPHRPQPKASGEQRLAMLQLACDGLDGIEPCDLELQRSDFSYSAVTAGALRQQYPQVNFSWVIGADAWAGFERWHQPEALLDQVNLLVINRPGSHHSNETAALSSWQQQQLTQRQCPLAQLLAASDGEIQGKISFGQLPELAIAASDLRQALKQGDNVRFLVPDAVLAYLTQHQLYR